MARPNQMSTLAAFCSSSDKKKKGHAFPCAKRGTKWRLCLTHQTLEARAPRTPPGEGLQLEPPVKYSVLSF